MGGADTDAETVDEAADDQHADVLRGTDDYGADDPDLFQRRRIKDIGGLKSYQMTEPIMIAFLRPKMSDMKPEHRAASHDPPAIEAVMPP